MKNIILERSEIISIKKIKNFVRDVKDDYLISLAIEGNADFLITGDKDLLVLKSVEKSKIVTMAEFLKEHF